jgi:excisionase family DNA binding protein
MKSKPIARLGTDLLTSGQIAAICRVSPRTVGKWIDAGLIRGYRVGKDRRAEAAEVDAFLERNGMTAARHRLHGQRTVLVVGLPNIDLSRWNVLLASDPFTAGRLTVEHMPSRAVVGWGLGRGEGLGLVRNLVPRTLRVVGVCGEDETHEQSWIEAGCAAVLRWPVDPSKLEAVL